MSATTAPSSPIPVCVVGFGNSARTFHLPFVLALPQLFTLHSIQQRPRTAANASSSPDASKLFSNVTVLPDFDAVLTSLPKNGLIIVTTTNDTHFPFAKRALEAGFNVLVEKPVATNEADVQVLIDLQEKTGKLCAVYQNRRFDGDFLTIQSLLADKGAEPSALGVPTYFESRFDRFRPYAKGGWREEVDPDTQGGGMLWDLGSHLIDQALFLFGPPESVTGFVRNQRNQGPAAVDDDWLAILNYASSAPLPPSSPASGSKIGGLRVSLGATCLSSHVDAEQPRFRVEGTRGSYEKRGTDPQENQLKLGWTPSSHPDEFGVYSDTADPDSIRFGRLTTMVRSDEDLSLPTSGAGAASKQPQLCVANIPTLPGRYIDLFANVAASIRAASEAEAQRRNAAEALRKVSLVGVERTLNAVKLIKLIRESSVQGKTLQWS
ncbi:related to protein with NADP(H) oxidoreductase activity [Sporisorium reilianum f. sp. reilianum]|uniref:Related to protein with NADP(H) oxidoreductase activity n=1 Tax=Sporisorium reilianum f. sp. reilianum TaxID=72559 RepID=A0A2N8UAV2_9BASI|nr:related to protein with NADP(H) oxidoreductase activity [Sporisorium reilianum f. sp. reilianum]